MTFRRTLWLFAALLCIGAPSLAQRPLAGTRPLAGVRPSAGTRPRAIRNATLKTVSDSATGTEGPSLGISGGATQVTVTESGSGADSVTTTAALTVAESSTGSEGLSNGAAVNLSDTGTGTETQSAGTAAKPASTATINASDELGDVAFCVPILEGSGNTLKDYVSGTTSVADTNLGAHWSTIDSGVAWSGPCIDNTGTGTRGGAHFTTPSALTASGHVWHTPNNNLNAVTICMLLQPVYSNTVNQGALNHLADMGGLGTALFGGYENAGTNPNFAGTFQYGTLKNQAGSSLGAITWPASSTNPWTAIIIEWGAGRGGGCTVYTNLDSGGNYSTTLRTAATAATADWQATLSTITADFNAIGPYGSGSPVGFRGKPACYMLWERALSSQERSDWLANPWRMLS